MKVYFSELAEKKLLELSDHLLDKWNLKTKTQFLSKLKKKIDQINTQPNSCPESKEIKGLFKCVVTKQTTFYYQVNIEKQEIEIITLFDSRQNPNNLKKQLK